MRRELPFRRVSVLGLGRTGRAVVEALSSWGFRVFLSEVRPLRREEKGLLERLGVQWEEGGHTTAALETDLLVPSPGVSPRNPILMEAHRRGIPVWSEVELAFTLASPRRIAAITGTNGKTTTTALLGAILSAAGERAVVAGNIGRPAIGTVGEVEGGIWVLEVSSYQLEHTHSFHPHVAVWLNFAPDHLDHHGSLGAYFAAKAKVLRNQNQGDVALLPRELLGKLSPRGRVLPIEDVELPWPQAQHLPAHLVQDIRAAWGGARALVPGITPPPWEALEPALHQPHRLEPVGNYRGVPFIDDSKATNAHATAAALRALEGRGTLILGGRHKGAGYEVLRDPLLEKVIHCVLIGESQEFFARMLETWGIPFTLATNPLNALRAAYSPPGPGDWVLLSPACSSFDQFDDFSHRGRAFRKAFGQLSRSQGQNFSSSGDGQEKNS